ncbi:MAG: KH domain-containing protein [Candidatus Eremiobacteraeota bacterium]|nr:KH domain-containing protein [Candidatus Eremiobacteraeota bacterium]
MSSFDDEFGLFGDGEAEGESEERRSSLGARTIASGETVIDDVEPEDEPAPRRGRPPKRETREPHVGTTSRAPRAPRPPKDPQAAHARATSLLEFLTKKLVSKPDVVEIDAFTAEQGERVVEVAVDPEDLGKVIGRGGRVAHALRTIVRATAEERVIVDFFDLNEFEGDFEDGEPEGDQQPE